MISAYRESASALKSKGRPQLRAYRAALLARWHAKQVRASRFRCDGTRLGATSRWSHGQTVLRLFLFVPWRTESMTLLDRVPHRRFVRRLSSPLPLLWQPSVPSGGEPRNVVRTSRWTGRVRLDRSAPTLTHNFPSVGFSIGLRIMPRHVCGRPLLRMMTRSTLRTRPRSDASYPGCPGIGSHRSAPTVESLTLTCSLRLTEPLGPSRHRGSYLPSLTDLGDSLPFDPQFQGVLSNG